MKRQARLRRFQRMTLKSEDSSRRDEARQKKMKRQQDIQRILEDFKGVKNIPGIKSAKRRGCSSPR